MSMRFTFRKLGLSVVLGLTALGMQAATTTTIVVNTFADENGSGATCSLREAITVVNDSKKVSFGGCTGGGLFDNYVIQLSDGTYVLDPAKGELSVRTSAVIVGRDTLRPDLADPYTGTKPSRVRPTTIIDAAGNSRIFSTGSYANVALSLKDLELTRGRAADINNNMAKGGAIYASGPVSLDNVIISNSKAVASGTEAGSGGAIYLAQNAADLTMNDSTLVGNTATGKGGAVSMVCYENGDASHALSMVRSAVISNESTAGAGAFNVCGSSSVAFSASTIGKNVSASASAALSFVSPRTNTGSVGMAYMTFAENPQAALELTNLASASVTSSLLLYNGTGCINFSSTAVSTDYNTLDNASCATLMAGTNQNKVISGGPAAPVSDDGLGGDLLVLDYRGGLSKGYLPTLDSVNVLDKGDTLTACKNLSDQRYIYRGSGAKCDRGAMERMRVTANDDTADSAAGTGRVAVVDILSNDKFGEKANAPLAFKTDSSGSVHDAVTLVSTPKIDGSSGTTPGFDANDICRWDLPANPGKLTVNTKGVLTTSTAPIKCTYRVTDSDNNTSAAVATVTVNINNSDPRARDDSYVRPVGTVSISFNPLLNDDDNGDLDASAGSYPATQWPQFSIYVSSTGKPKLGTIDAPMGHCPDWTGTNPKLCYSAPLKYTAKDANSPFTDTFSYAVVDADGDSSGTATVTIATDSPDKDKGEGGSLDIFAGLAIVLLGLRRARKL